MSYVTIEEAKKDWIPIDANVLVDHTNLSDDGGTIVYAHHGELLVTRIFRLGDRFHTSIDYQKRLDTISWHYEG